jgi:hypothetical protein
MPAALGLILATRFRVWLAFIFSAWGLSVKVISSPNAWVIRKRV